MSKHLPEKVNNIGQTVGINHEGKGFGQNDDGHIALEAHLGQGSQHTEKVSWTNGPNHHKNKETVKTIALIQPADILVIGTLADDSLPVPSPTASRPSFTSSAPASSSTWARRSLSSPSPPSNRPPSRGGAS